MGVVLNYMHEMVSEDENNLYQYNFYPVLGITEWDFL